MIYEIEDLQETQARLGVNGNASALAELGHSVAACFSSAGTPIEDRFTQMLDAARTAFEMDQAFVTLRNRAQISARFCSSGARAPKMRKDRLYLSQWMLTHQKPLALDHRPRSAVTQHCDLTGHRPTRFLGAPIFFDGRIYGTLECTGAHCKTVPLGDLETAMIELLCVISAAPLVLLGKA